MLTVMIVMVLLLLVESIKAPLVTMNRNTSQTPQNFSPSPDLINHLL